MSDTKNTGGPAFPTSPDNFGSTDASVHGGMTLRDYFAAKAMQAMLHDQRSIRRTWRYFRFILGGKPHGILLRHEYDYNNTAKAAYAMADAMLKAREQ
jgi:hypothetical protein